jgi:hypothetical protein
MYTSIRTMLLLGVVLSALTVFDGCGSGKDVACPSTSENITWNSYGQLSFGNEGDDSTARSILSKCSWHVFGGHNGGVGDTLEVASSGEEVVLAWAYNNFSSYRVATGWTGTTDKGLKMGDSLSVFQSIYPNFTRANFDLYTFSQGNTYVEAHFNAGSLVELIVGQYFR